MAQNRSSLGKGLAMSFLAGAVVGGIVGAVAGTVDYGTFDVGFLFNYVLGGALIGGVLIMLGVAGLRWRRRHPLA